MADNKYNSLSPEQLSQLMDGEWHDLDVQNCVANACNDETLRADWARWHLIRDVARGEAVAAPAHTSSLASRIHDAIAEEPTYSNVRSISSGKAVAAESQAPAAAAEQASQRRPFAWSSALTGAALAASVAVATVVGLDVIGSGAQPGAEAPAQVAAAELPADGEIANPNLPEVEFVSNSGTSSFWVTQDANGELGRSDSEERLNVFLSEHLEHSPTAQRTGMLPYSRLIGYDQPPTPAANVAVDEAAER